MQAASPGLARIAGLAILATVILMVLSEFVLSGGAPPARSTSAAHLTALTARHRLVPEIASSLDVLAPICFLVFALLLIGRLGDTGRPWSTVLLIGTTLWIGMDVIFDGAMYALRELAHYGTGVQGVPALFFLGQGILWSNGEIFGLIFASLGILALRNHALPAILGWVALVLAVIAFLVPALSLSPLAPVSFAGELVMLLWLAVTGVTLLVQAPAWAGTEGRVGAEARPSLSHS